MHVISFCFRNNLHHLLKRLTGYLTLFGSHFGVRQRFSDAVGHIASVANTGRITPPVFFCVA